MPARIRQTTRSGLRGTLHWFALALLLPTSLLAGGHTIKVPPPNGVDDTAVIQRALDEAVAKGPGTTVQLAAGKYLTQQLVTYNFHGTFKGEGKDKTILEALPELLVNIPDFCLDVRMPNGTTNRWPSLIIFVDGDIRVSDLVIKITATQGTATTPWLMCGGTYTNLIDVLRFMGQYTTHARVDRIAIEGSPDDSPNSWGYNAWNGVMFAGELPHIPYKFDLDYYFLSGTLAVRGSHFKSLNDGVCVDGFIQNAKVTLGGSPGEGNVTENTNVGFDMEAAENSHFEISYNQTMGNYAGMWIIPWLDPFVPSKPSQYSIHDNTFATSGPYADGIYLWNDPSNPWIRGMIYHNTIEQKSDFMWAGIGAYNTKGTFLWNNTITGSGAAAIQLGGDEAVDTLCTVLGNHLRGFSADPSFGLAQIHLGPATSHNLVVCASPLDTVLDEGTRNLIIGGWPQAKAPLGAARLRAIPGPSSIRLNPMNRRLAPRR